MKKIIFILLLCLFVANNTFAASTEKMLEVLGETFYTKVNMWNSNRIATWSRHRGTLVPLGTKVEIASVTKNSIYFKLESGVKVEIRRSIKTGAYMPELFKLYFSKKNVKGAGGGYNRLSDFDKANVDAGTVTPGMTRSAVVLAYGYPPDKMSRFSMTGPLWTYYGKDRLQAYIKLYFKDDVVVKIDNVAHGKKGPFGVHRTRVETVTIEDTKRQAKLEQLYNHVPDENSMSDELEKISNLYSEGMLTESEFKEAKRQILLQN